MTFPAASKAFLIVAFVTSFFIDVLDAEWVDNELCEKFLPNVKLKLNQHSVVTRERVNSFFGSS